MAPRGAVGVDIGGTHTRIGGTYTRIGAPAPHDGADGATVRAAVRFATDPDYDRQVAAIVRAIRSVCPEPAGVGVSVGGRVDSTGERVSVALNLPGYQGRMLRDDLSRALSCPVRLAHDATCGLLGEHAYGALRGFDRCGYVTLSTGTGCAIRLGDATRFVVSTTEAGHQLVAGNDLACDCGQRGCLQTLTGGRALQRRLGVALADLDDPAFWRGYARALALGLANLALVAGVEVVALGGGVIAHRPEIWAWLRESLGALLTYRDLTVVAARLGEDAPLTGAVRLLQTPEPCILH